ncbi:MAG: hypothetical protein IPH15_18195 [Comamonadaceae bacterium]|nr:hypothetical protein [Comamonadaceae bacterium]
MILADDRFATILLAVREERGVLDSIRKFLRYPAVVEPGRGVDGVRRCAGGGDHRPKACFVYPHKPNPLVPQGL